MPKLKKKGRIVRIDFTGVEAGGGRAVPDGNYTLKVKEVTQEESRDGNPYLKWVWSIASGPCKGSTIYDNTSLQAQSLWRLKTLLGILEVEVPDSAEDFDLDAIEESEKEVDVEITNETYEGKQKPRITGFLGEGGTASAAPSKKATSSKVKDEPEEEEEENDDEENEAPKKTVKKKSSFKVGQKVKFTDDDNKTQRGTITAIDGADATVDVKGEEWTISSSELEAA